MTEAAQSAVVDHAVMSTTVAPRTIPPTRGNWKTTRRVHLTVENAIGVHPGTEKAGVGEDRRVKGLLTTAAAQAAAVDMKTTPPTRGNWKTTRETLWTVQNARGRHQETGKANVRGKRMVTMVMVMTFAVQVAVGADADRVVRPEAATADRKTTRRIHEESQRITPVTQIVSDQSVHHGTTLDVSHSLVLQLPKTPKLRRTPKTHVLPGDLLTSSAKTVAVADLGVVDQGVAPNRAGQPSQLVCD